MDKKLQKVYNIGLEELSRITAEDWKKAIDLASKQEKLYAEVDGLQLDTPSVPIPTIVQEQAPILQQPIIYNEIIPPINLQKCTNCTFESKIPRILKLHLNSIRKCSNCPETFCGERAKRQHSSHEKKHEVKPPKEEHICSFCKKPFPIASRLKQHLTWSACGRK